MLFGDLLRELRLAAGWTQKELADRAGASQQGLARWESGEREPDFSSVIALCKALGVKCTRFDQCEFAEVAEKRTPGRPKAKPAAKRKKKGGAK